MGGRSMLRVLSCVGQEHDLRLVGLAVIICIVAAFIAFTAFGIARDEPSRRLSSLSLAGAVSGLGIWATHFVAMLAYEPDLSIGYDLELTMLSVAVAVVIAG